MAGSGLQKIIDEDKQYLFQNYGNRLPVCFRRGEKALLFDQDGKRYIDFFSGIAVSGLGYSDSSVRKALLSGIDRVIHTSNWFLNKEQIETAKLISQLSFEGKTLFVNSGTEANEAAIKLARRYGLSASKKKIEIITFDNSFHGRTLGSMSATAQKKIRNGFGPLLPGFTYLPFNDTAAFNKYNKKNTAAVILELIQGEGGIKPADKDFTKSIQKFCKDNDVLLIIDEIQTGIGRTGVPFAYQHYGLNPDIITMAKGIAAGLPLGAMHAESRLVDYLPAGSHGTTFGGNHLSCAAATAVLKQLKGPGLLKNVESANKIIIEKLNKLKDKYDIIKEIRGLGLHIGIELTVPGSDLVKKALEAGLIINCTSENVIRIMPPLNIRKKEIDEGMKIFEKLINEEVPN